MSDLPSWLKTDQSIARNKTKQDNLPSWLKNPQPKPLSLTPPKIVPQKHYGGVVDVNDAAGAPVPKQSYTDILNKYVDNGSTFSFKDIGNMYDDIGEEEDSTLKRVGKGAWGTLTYLLGTPNRNKFTGRALDTARDAIGGEGSTVDYKGNVLEKKDAGTVGNILADIAGTGLGFSMPINNMQGVNKITDEALKPIFNKLPQAAGKLGQYGMNALRTGSDFAAGNVVQGLAQGKTVEDSLKSGGEGFLQGAAFGTALKGVGDISKSALPGWKTTFESTKPIETPEPIKEVAATKPVLKGKFKVKNTALENAQNEYNEAVKKIQNYWGHWQLDEAEIKLGAEELGIDLDGILNKMGKAESEGVNIRDIAERQRMATVAGVKELPSNKLQNPLLQAPKLETNTNIPVQDLTPNIKAKNEAAATAKSAFNPAEKPNQKIVTGEKGAKPSLKERWENAYMRIVDNKKAINKADETAYIKATNSANSGSVVGHVMEENLVDKEGKTIGNSLKKTLEDNVPKGQETDFWEYALQRHNVGRAGQEKPIYFKQDGTAYTPQESAARVQYLEQLHPEWKQQADNITKWIDDFMQEWGVKAGTVDAETYANLRTMYPDYIPTNRSFDDLEDFLHVGGGNGKGFVNQNTPIKKATGSERNIIDPIENIMNLVNRTIRTAKYNEVGQEFARAIEQNPNMAKLAKFVPEPKGKADNVVRILIDGKPKYIQVNDKNLLAALEAVYKADVGDIEAVVKKGTNIFKSLITTKNPVFAIRNMFRDIPTAYINGSEANPVKFFIDLAKATKDIVSNSEKFKQYKGVGGGGSNFFNSGSPTKSASQLTGRVPIVKNGEIVGYKNSNIVKQGFKKVGDIIEHVNNIVESAPRLAEFNRVLDKTGDVNKALYAANDVTTNFSRGGDITKHIDSFVPYLNAGVQGLDKLARQFVTKPIPTAAKGLIGITSATLILDHVNKDNSEYQGLDNRTKDNYFLIPKDDGTFIKIPKSREYGVLFSDLFERVLRSKRGDNQAFKGFGNTVATNFSPANPLEANIFSPALGLKSNKDFANRDIIPRAMIEDNRSKYLQYDEKTSEITKWFAEEAKKAGLDLSPKQMDYLIRSYTGVIGQLGLPATTKATMSGSNTKEKLLKPITSQFIADPLYSNQNITDFYDNYDKIKTLAADKNINESIPSKTLTNEEKYKNLYTKTSKEVSDLNKKIREAEMKGNTEEIKLLRAKIIEAVMKANKEFGNYKK